jgi:hypothetical protein
MSTTTAPETIDNFSRRERVALILAVVAMAWYFGFNFFFGWNAEAQSPAEGAADFMIFILFLLSYLWKPSKTIIENNQTVYQFRVKNGTTISHKSR